MSFIKKFVEVLVFLFFLCGMAHEGKRTYIFKYLPIATELAHKYQIPRDLILAVAVLESGFGTSHVSKKYNNHFGIMQGKRYRKFETVEQGYEAFAKLVHRRWFYEKMRGEADTAKWIVSLSNSNYCTNASYWRQQVLKVNEDLKDYIPKNVFLDPKTSVQSQKLRKIIGFEL